MFCIHKSIFTLRFILHTTDHVWNFKDAWRSIISLSLDHLGCFYFFKYDNSYSAFSVWSIVYKALATTKFVEKGPKKGKKSNTFSLSIFIMWICDLFSFFETLFAVLLFCSLGNRIKFGLISTHFNKLPLLSSDCANRWCVLPMYYITSCPYKLEPPRDRYSRDKVSFSSV